jgi:hypothetical protein
VQGASPELAQCSPGSAIRRNRRETQREFIEIKALRLNVSRDFTDFLIAESQLNVVWWPAGIVLASRGRVRNPGRRLDCAVGLCAHRGWARPVDAKTDLCASQTGLGADGAQCSLACIQRTLAPQQEGAWTGEIGRWQVSLHCLWLESTFLRHGFSAAPGGEKLDSRNTCANSRRRLWQPTAIRYEGARWQKKL